EPPRSVANPEHCLRRGDERVVAALHRRGPGVSGLPVEDQLTTCVADDSRDDAERRRRDCEHRTLLHVELEERGRHRAAADSGATPDAADLLPAKDHDRAAAGPLDRLDRGYDAESAVEAAS